MANPGSPVRARLSAEAPQALVLTQLVLVMGSRAGLSIDQLDDVAMAIEVIVRGAARPRWAELRAEAGSLEVAIGDVDGEWVEERMPLLSALVTDVQHDGESMVLRVRI
jgi:hypothetical protein